MDLTVTLRARGGTDKGRTGDLWRGHDRTRDSGAGNKNNGDNKQQTRTNTPGYILRSPLENLLELHPGNTHLKSRIANGFSTISARR